MGVVLFEVLYRRSPWGEEIKEKVDKSQILALIEEKLALLAKAPASFFPETQREIPENFKFLLISMLRSNESLRVGFEDLSKNPLFSEKMLKSLSNSMKNSEEFKEIDNSPSFTRIPLEFSQRNSSKFPDFQLFSQASKRNTDFFSESTQRIKSPMINSLRFLDSTSKINEQTIQLTPDFRDFLPVKQVSRTFEEKPCQTVQVTPEFLDFQPVKQISLNFPLDRESFSSVLKNPASRKSCDSRQSLEYRNFPDPEPSQIEEMIASLNLRYIPYKTIKKGALIKAGGFGQVFHATINTVEYAIKEISSVTCEFINKILREAHNLKNYENPRLVKIYGISYRRFLCDAEESLVLYLVFELKQGDLQMAIQSKALSFSQKLKIAYQISQGICHLHNHENPLVHADLKPSNILLDESLNAFITDLGISKTIIGKDITCSQAFSAGYAAPEQVNKDVAGFKITVKTDIWSLGLVFYYVFFEKNVKMEFLFGKNSLLVGDCEEELKGVGKLVEKMVVWESGKRICIEEAMEGIREISSQLGVELKSIRL